MVLDLERKIAEVSAAMAEAERFAHRRASARVLAPHSHDLRQPPHALVKSVYSAILAARPDAK